MVDVNMYCFGFSVGVWDMGSVSKEKGIAERDSVVCTVLCSIKAMRSF